MPAHTYLQRGGLLPSGSPRLLIAGYGAAGPSTTATVDGVTVASS